ncbi:MAG: polymer-forming cytoskeletal protein [Bacteroidales bacterium]|nr:polymer-forming cytoskeletal protein [Bacteroidales bacterium]
MKLKDSISSGASHNTLAQGTLVKGDIKAEEDLRIDGKIEGTIECVGRVVIGPHAEILGNVHCANMDLLGAVNGKLHIRETFSMRSSGSFTGEVTAGSLEIEPGAVFNGTCKME